MSSDNEVTGKDYEEYEVAIAADMMKRPVVGKLILPKRNRLIRSKFPPKSVPVEVTVELSTRYYLILEKLDKQGLEIKGATSEPKLMELCANLFDEGRKGDIHLLKIDAVSGRILEFYPVKLAFYKQDTDGRPCNILSHYHCEDCGVSWDDDWSCACNDECARCGAEIEPMSHSLIPPVIERIEE